MPRLSAKFTIPITAPCLVAFPEADLATKLNVQLDEFEVSVELVFPYQRYKKSDAHEWISGLDELVITIAREEVEPLPEVVNLPGGRRDSTAQQQYLSDRLPLYRAPATEIANRVLSYFRYTLHTPKIQLLSPYLQEFNNPEWYDEHGSRLVAAIVAMAHYLLGVRGELSVQPLTPTMIGDLEVFLRVPTDPSLVDMLMSDAQTAWFENSLRRSVLELAICVEVVVKRHYFSQDSAAGAAFDYLEDKAKVSVRVLELIDTIANEAFGSSYKMHSPDSYRCIDHLFRCRNKLAHRGQLMFRDDAGALVSVDAELVKTWWDAVLHLRGWLSGLTRLP